MNVLAFVLLVFQTPPATWDALAGEYDSAVETWSREPEAAPHPLGAYWARFDELAARGEGRAVLWMISNASERKDATPESCAALVARLPRGCEEAWMGTAFFELGADPERFGAEAVAALLEERTRPEHERSLRAYAGLALAEAIAEEDAARAAHLRVWSVSLLHESVELAPEKRLSREDAQRLAQQAIPSVDEEHEAHFGIAYRKGSDGDYYPVSGAPPDPRERWRPVIEELAFLGSSRARLWALSNASWKLTPAYKARLQGFLEALAQETLTREELSSFGGEIGGLVYRIGLEAVEPSIRKLIERNPDEARPALLFGLGEAVCDTSRGDAALRERGVALLREVRETWPASDLAKRAEGRIFRYTNLLVGKPMPDFETVDADGNAFKLSDYRGKVTVVDFWGFW